MSRILVISQYYYPEQFRINDICEDLVKKGHGVTVVTGIPNYPEGKFYSGYNWFRKRKEIVNGVNIIRLPIVSRGKSNIRLAINYASYVVTGWFFARFTRVQADKVFIFEVSPMTQALVGTTFGKRRRIPCSIYVQDLWPENLEVIGNIKNKAVIKLINRMVDSIYTGCSYILATSPSLKKHLEERESVYTPNGDSKVLYWPQYAEDFYKPEDRGELPPDFPDNDLFKVAFTGNVGFAQGLDILPRVAKELKKGNVIAQFVIIGDGRYLPEFKNLIDELDVSEYFALLGRKKATEIPKYLAWCDAGFISFAENELFDMTIPAKLQSYMACGKMIIAAAEGETKRIISEAKCGVCVPNGDANSLLTELMRCINGGVDKEEMGINALKYARTYYSKSVLMEQFEWKID